MIRLIQRRLIIPQGDTGTFTIPIQGEWNQGDIAILSIYDPLTHTTVLNKEGVVNNEAFNFSFIPTDTSRIEPSKRYLWDITLYRGATYNSETQEIINPTSVDSYYAGFKLPTCEIRTVAGDVQK